MPEKEWTGLRASENRQRAKASASFTPSQMSTGALGLLSPDAVKLTTKNSHHSFYLTEMYEPI